MFRIRATWTAILFALVLGSPAAFAGIDLNGAVITVADQPDRPVLQTAATVLAEEVQKRTGIAVPIVTTLPEDRAAIVLGLHGSLGQWGIPAASDDASAVLQQPEGYWVHADTSGAQPRVWISGADGRGVLFGVGAVLRKLDWAPGSAALPEALDLCTAPASPIRGHQLGYRARANSWDAWTLEQFDQYIRELALFGMNAVENIPFQDEQTNAMMKYSREEMNREMSRICDRYDLAYWVWTPAEFDLADTAQRGALLARHRQLYEESVRVDGVFFPGGDPGDNPPELVMPFLADIAKELLPRHPDARVWLSLQGYREDAVQRTYAYVKEHQPTWLGGFVGGPSSPPIAELRANLPAQYQLRMYPDITHNKLAQYEVPWWDPAYANTLGREAINPRPAQYAQIHNWYAPYCDGFISYSDGVHDDVNKNIWSALSWDPDTKIRAILEDYCRFFFGPEVAAAATDGILALENNWQGSLADNGAVEGTLLLWQGLEKAAPELAGNWRWQMNLVRAYYDAYTRRRLIAESAQEQEVNATLRAAGVMGSAAAIAEARAVLARPDSVSPAPALLARIEALCKDLFDSIQLQTSVPVYGASGAERGAFLDFVNYPLNSRWWLEDELAKVEAMTSEDQKCTRLHELATWEDPGPGSFYDDIGNIAQSAHVRRVQSLATNPIGFRIPSPTHWWLDNGLSRLRISSLVTMDFPEAVVYEGLDPAAAYTVRLSGYGQMLLRIDGERVQGDKARIKHGEVVNFVVPASALADRRIELTWDRPTDEAHLNWRQQSRVAESWLLKH